MLLAWVSVYALPILNTFVPHVGHTPWVAGLPFFIVMAFGFLISTFFRHFMQYACIGLHLRSFRTSIVHSQVHCQQD